MQNNILDGIASFKTLFNGLTKLGLPLLWDGNIDIYSKYEYQNRLRKKKIGEHEEVIERVIGGYQDVEILNPTFHIWIKSKQFSKRWDL